MPTGSTIGEHITQLPYALTCLVAPHFPRTVTPPVLPTVNYPFPVAVMSIPPPAVNGPLLTS